MVTWWLGTWMLTNFWYISTFITSSDRTDTTAIKVLPQTLFQKRNGLPSDQGGQITMCALMFVFEWAFCKDFKLHWLQEKDCCHQSIMQTGNKKGGCHTVWLLTSHSPQDWAISFKNLFLGPAWHPTLLSYHLQKLVFLNRTEVFGAREKGQECKLDI